MKTTITYDDITHEVTLMSSECERMTSYRVTTLPAGFVDPVQCGINCLHALILGAYDVQTTPSCTCTHPASAHIRTYDAVSCLECECDVDVPKLPALANYIRREQLPSAPLLQTPSPRVKP